MDPNDKDSFLDALKRGVRTKSVQETMAWGKALAAFLPREAVLLLSGDLGTGKTAFVKGLAQGLEITETLTSPSFAIFSIYEGKRQLVHMDAYRLADARAFEALMVEEFLKPPFCLAVEWPEKIADALPADALHLHFETEGKTHIFRRVDAPR